ncbi:hypothetical protein [Nonomuraea recticatena]|uniref:hypothetical protein n=1 Tax=Nonomuraea recticatena TaxID=46178 RepID=UPI00360C1621
MDDLRMLRDLGHELEHEPPASLARQRHRYQDSPRRRFRLGGWPMLGLAAVATAAAVAVPMVLVGGQQTLSSRTVPAPAGLAPSRRTRRSTSCSSAPTPATGRATPSTARTARESTREPGPTH